MYTCKIPKIIYCGKGAMRAIASLKVTCSVICVSHIQESAVFDKVTVKKNEDED